MSTSTSIPVAPPANAAVAPLFEVDAVALHEDVQWYVSKILSCDEKPRADQVGDLSQLPYLNSKVCAVRAIATALSVDDDAAERTLAHILRRALLDPA